MGPRSRDRGNIPLPPETRSPIGLQWGRDHAIAEMVIADLVQYCRDALQWGRDHAIAEMTSFASSSSPRRLLQWGRDHAIAEMMLGLCIGWEQGRLQWGRDHAIAEIQLPRGCGSVLMAASMGPRSRDRGNVLW